MKQSLQTKRDERAKAVKERQEQRVNALNNGAHRERERIVRWLREDAYRLSGMGMSEIAIEIEAGKHLPPKRLR